MRGQLLFRYNSLTGFSAREKDGEFQFASQVSGFIVTDDEEGGNR